MLPHVLHVIRYCGAACCVTNRRKKNYKKSLESTYDNQILIRKVRHTSFVRIDLFESLFESLSAEEEKKNKSPGMCLTLTTTFGRWCALSA